MNKGPTTMTTQRVARNALPPTIAIKMFILFFLRCIVSLFHGQFYPSLQYKYSSLPFSSSPFLLLPILTLSSLSIIMMISTTCATPSPMHFSGNDEPYKFQCQETRLIEELMSLVQQGNESKSTSTSPNTSGSNRGLFSVAERKRRRMTSNRESARRSRWKKKRHLEDLDEEANRLRMTNRELKNRLGFAAEKCHVTWRENEMLEGEALALRARLSQLNRVLVAMQTMKSQQNSYI